MSKHTLHHAVNWFEIPVSNIDRAQAFYEKLFAAKLEQATPAKVELYDEWLSTREAAGRLRAQGLNTREQRGRIDSAAAAILLQSWLDRGAQRED